MSDDNHIIPDPSKEQSWKSLAFKSVGVGALTYAAVKIMGYDNGQNSVLGMIGMEDSLILAGAMAGGAYFQEKIKNFVTPYLPLNVTTSPAYDKFAGPVAGVLAGAAAYSFINTDGNVVGLNAGGLTLLGVSVATDLVVESIDPVLDPFAM